ncbi:hypothetical protein CROQUDRAFT_670228 [Cronartium quercuum f. sp. fusiforme G11]|uniref:SET domain-containing protein n=1 Tax=Cronartium quercuum f. sp. fusiforme G11 TaxID=708437 RepID=A0A9P6TD05_9BASI|nr:hypothetical protein CROQUDRAFT_670228 [Cronartium quercuum f. sp. fusiforme G11]
MCIFVNLGFAKGRGLVVLTRPSLFKESLPQFSSAKPSVEDVRTPIQDLPFVVTEMPHKGGKGAVADRELHLGDEIIIDLAYLVVYNGDETWMRFDGLLLLECALALLPIGTRAEFFKLHAVGETKAEIIKSIIVRNGFETHFGKAEVPHYALFTIPSRFNHDCRPNVAYFFGNDPLKISKYAVRDIAPGEELTNAYCDPIGTREERHQCLEQYGFTCACSLCSLPKPAAKISNYRLHQIYDFFDRLSDFSDSSTGTPAMAEELISLHKIERLESEIFEAYASAAMAYNAAGDTQQARTYAALSLAYGKVSTGPKWTAYRDVMQLKHTPESHWTYMTWKDK